MRSWRGATRLAGVRPTATPQRSLARRAATFPTHQCTTRRSQLRRQKTCTFYTEIYYFKYLKISIFFLTDVYWGWNMQTNGYRLTNNVILVHFVHSLQRYLSPEAAKITSSKAGAQLENKFCKSWDCPSCNLIIFLSIQLEKSMSPSQYPARVLVEHKKSNLSVLCRCKYVYQILVHSLAPFRVLSILGADQYLLSTSVTPT